MNISSIRQLIGVAGGVALLVGLAGTVRAQQATIVGTVTDAASGAPVADARVSIVGTALRGVTNFRGAYRITGVPPGTVTVEVRGIGYKTTQAQATLGGGQEYASDFRLTTSVVTLEEVVVTGTAGEQQRRAQAATVSDINVAGLKEVAPITSVQDILRSRLPGVSVTSASGTSGTSNQIRVRGASSISLSNEPLLYIDGVRVVTGGGLQTDPGVFFTGGQLYERLNDLDPDDIESIELVKGPAASTLYGADASTGVIQIITKRGRPGTAKFTQTVSLEYNSIDRNFEPRTNYARCSVANDTTPNNLLCFGKGAGTLVSDNPLLRENAFRTGRTARLGWSGRGGGANYGYYTSVNSEAEDGVLPNNGFNRKAARVNFNWVPLQNLTLDAGVGITRSQADLPDNDNNIFGWLGNSHLGLPTTRTVDGSGQNGWFGTQRDVAAMKLIENGRQTHRTIGTVTANWTPRHWFSNRFTAGVDWVREEDRRFLPKNARGSYAVNVGQINESRRGIERYTLDYLGNIEHNLSASVVSNVSFGFQLVDTREEVVFATGEGLAVNSNNVVSGASLRSGGQDWKQLRGVGFIGQWQVGLNNRLYGQVGMRFDNASSFGTESKWVSLPKVGVSWVASEEPFWKVGFLNTLRLRAAWGSTGRIPQPGSSLFTFASAPYIDGAIVAPGAVPQNPGNPGLRFERGEEFEGGFDAGLFHDRVGVELTFFNKVSKDLILQEPLAPSLGFTQNPFVNIGSMVNRGLEISLKALPVNTPTLSWDFGLSAGTLHNEVTDMGDVPPFGTLNRVEAGMQLGTWVSNRIRSINEATGEVLVDSVRSFAGKVLPTLEGNVTTTLTLFRNFRIYGLLDTKRGHRVRDFTDFFRETQLVRSDSRLDTLKLSRHERLRRYGNPNAGPGVPAFVTVPGCTGLASGPGGTTCGRTVNDVQEAYIQDGDFVRFREFSLTYTLPNTVARAFRAQTASVTLSGQNLALWTNYEGYDPEVVSNAGALYNRDDFFTQPPVRRWIARVNLTF
jgi:TonB-dependent starch-binding outer membrane protein SusC